MRVLCGKLFVPPLIAVIATAKAAVMVVAAILHRLQCGMTDRPLRGVYLLIPCQQAIRMRFPPHRMAWLPYMLLLLLRHLREHTSLFLREAALSTPPWI